MQVTRTRETKNYADGGLIQTVKEKLFGPSGPPETITQKYARQDAERAAKTPAAAAMAAPAPAPQRNAISDYASGMQSTMQRREAAAGLKDGGTVKAKPIKGAGTGTSDSIARNMRPGSFVMPADSTKKMAVPVKVSNGESEFTPEQVHAIGAKVLDMVKGSTHKPAAKKSNSRAARQLADGGEVPLDSQAASDRKRVGSAVATLSDMNTRAGAAIADVGTMPLRGLAGAYDTAVVRPMRAAGINAAYTSPMVSPAGADPASQTPFYDQIRARDAVGAGRGTVNPPVVNPMAAMPSVQPTTSAAGAGRGSVNPAPAAINQPAGAGRGFVNPTPVDPNGPAPSWNPNTTVTLGGQAGAAVQGAPGVSKFTTADGRTLYSNVTGNDNNVLMSSRPGVQTIPAAAPTGGASPAAAAMSAGYDQPGVMSNGGGMRVIGGPSAGFFRTANGGGIAETPSLSTLGNKDISARELARLNNASGIAAGHDATLMADAQGRAAAQLAGQQISADAQRYGTDSNAKTAAQRLAMDAGVHSQDAPLKASQVKLAQQTDTARAAVLAAKTPEAKAAAEETLRTLQGKSEVAELYSTTVVPGVVDALGNKSPSTIVVTDRRTGKPVSYSAEGRPLADQPAAGAPKVSTKADFDKLAPGTTYTGADGKTYRKP